MEDISPEDVEHPKCVVRNEQENWNKGVRYKGSVEINQILEVSLMCCVQRVLWSLKVN